MRNKTPILVLTGLAIVAAAGVAGLTRDQWMDGTAPAVTTPETPVAAQQPEPPAQPTAPAAETAASAPAETPVAAAQPEAQPAPNEDKKQEVPSFDTVRVEKSGEAVIAGRAEAGSEVIVKLDGTEIAKTTANVDGAFVVVPANPLPAGSGALTIESKGKGDLNPTPSEQTVAIIVPAGQQQEALVAVVSPGAPTKVLQKPSAPVKEQSVAGAPALEPEPEAEKTAEQKPAKLVSIDAVDYDPAGNIVFSGQGERGNTARLYVDNSFVGDAPVAEDGRWTFSGTAEIAKGVHTLRVDGLDAQGNVVNRVEVPFFREENAKVAAATPAAEQAAQPAGQSQEPDVTEAPAATETPAASESPAAPDATAAAEAGTKEATATGSSPGAAPEPAAEQPAIAAVEQPASGAAAPEAATQDQPAAEAQAPVKAETQATKQSEETAAAQAGDVAEAAAQPSEGRVVIQPGNNLWRISRVLYGTGNKFTLLYEANKDQIRNPNLIYPGQIFKTPEIAPKADTVDPKRRDPLKPEETADPAQ